MFEPSVENTDSNVFIRNFVTEFTGNNGLEVPSKPTEARPPYIIDETNVKTKQQVRGADMFLKLQYV